VVTTDTGGIVVSISVVVASVDTLDSDVVVSVLGTGVLAVGLSETHKDTSNILPIPNQSNNQSIKNLKTRHM